MKTIFTLLASLIMSIAVFAVPMDIGAKPKSMLTVRSLDNGDIRVIVDGRRFEPGFNSLMIRDLDAGFHQIKVYRQKNNGRFTIVGRKYEMVYTTSLMVKPKTHVRISIDRFGRTTVDERKVRGNSSGRDNKDWDRNGDDRGFGDNKDRDIDWENGHDYEFERGGKLGDYDSNYGYERGMEDREFSRVLQSIDKEWLETNKLKSASQIVRSSNLSSAQVKQLVLLFNFENNKLELAKLAYQNTVDKKNYYTINDVFSFSGSRDELARYIRNFR